MIKLTNDIINFTVGREDVRDGYKAFAEYCESFKNNKANSASGKTFEEMNEKMLALFCDEVERFSGKKRSDYPDTMTYLSFQDVKQAAFTVVGMMTDLILPKTLIEKIGMISEVVNGQWGDSLKINLRPRDLFVVSKGGRNRRKYDLTRYFNGEVTIVPEPHGISVEVSLYDILTGKYTLAEMVTRAALSLENEIVRETYFAFAQAMNALPSAGTQSLTVNGWNTDSVTELIQKVQAWNGGAKAIMLGTKVALSKVLPESTNARISVDSDYVRYGYLREYFGTTTMELEQVADYTTEFGVLLPNDVIYVICPGVEKPVKVFFEGTTLSNMDNEQDNANLLVTGTLVKSWGTGVVTSALAGIIKLS